MVIVVDPSTEDLSAAARAEALARASDETGLPACDPIVGGLAAIAEPMVSHP